MNNELYAHELYLLGFEEGSKDSRGFYNDIGCPVTGLIYLHREHNGQHQYVSLTSYKGEFVEAIVQVYQNVYNSRAKVQQPSLHTGIYRNLLELTDALDKVYELVKKP
jgi:hypothetical protein